MSDTEQTVDTAECVEIVRALVAAFEAKGTPLQYNLRDEYDAESVYRSPWMVEVSTELVARGLKALGLPCPEPPKAKKIPALPSAAQARVLDYLNSRAEARLKTWRGWSYRNFYGLTGGVGGEDINVTKGTYEKLLAYKWIAFDRKEGNYQPDSYYKMTDAGYIVLTRYQEKAGVLGAPA